MNPLLKHLIVEREKRSSFPVLVRKAASLPYTIDSEKVYRYLTPPGRVFLFIEKRLFFLNLQRTKNTVASIPQARHDITDFIKLLIHSGTVYLHVRMGFRESVNPFRSGYDTHKFDALGFAPLNDGYSVDGGA